jgi:hypothetical protein
MENIEGIKYLRNRNDIERKTIEITINEELKESRKVVITPIGECYDILSIGENPNDIKYIEIKGHISLKIFKYVILSKLEFEFAKEKGDKYWIYLINIIKNKGAIILKIRDPINKLKWKILRKNKPRTIYLSNVCKSFNKNNTNFNFEIITKDIMEKMEILPINRKREIKIEDLKALNNIGNISKEEENRLKKLKLIKYRGGKITLTSSGIRLLKLIRNQKMKEEELYELLKKEQGKIPSLLKK